MPANTPDSVPASDTSDPVNNTLQSGDSATHNEIAASLPGPAHLSWKPDWSPSMTHSPRWQWRDTSGKLVEPTQTISIYSNEPVGNCSNRIANGEDTFYLFVPAITKSGHFVYTALHSMRKQGQREDYGYHSESMDNQKCNPSWWSQAVKETASYHEKYQKILKHHGIVIEPKECVRQYAEMAEASAVQALDKAYKRSYSGHTRPKFAAITLEDANKLQSYNFHESECTFRSDLVQDRYAQDPTMERPPPAIIRAINSVDNNGNNRGNPTAHCAHIFVKGSLTDSGLPDIHTTLVLPGSKEDLEKVPGVIWSMFPPVTGGNHASSTEESRAWANLTESVKSKYLQEDEQAKDPKWFSMDRRSKISRLESAMAAEGQMLIDKALEASESQHTDFNRPRVVFGFTDWVSGKLSTGFLDTCTLMGAPAPKQLQVGESAEDNWPDSHGDHGSVASVKSNSTVVPAGHAEKGEKDWDSCSVASSRSTSSAWTVVPDPV